MGLRRKRHCVFSIECHIIFVVKYRRKCITPEMGTYLVDEARRLLGGWNAELVEGKADVDHLHLLVSVDPGYQISDMVGSVKGVLSRNVRKRYHDYLQDFLWGDSFWTPSYYISSVGDVDREAVRKYIEDQGKPKRKYVRKK